MPSSRNQAINDAIRQQAKGELPDLRDHQAVNRSIREAAGVPSGPEPRPTLTPPPLPGEAETEDFRAWAEHASAAGVPDRELADYTARWLVAHRRARSAD